MRNMQVAQSHLHLFEQLDADCSGQGVMKKSMLPPVCAYLDVVACWDVLHAGEEVIGRIANGNKWHKLDVQLVVVCNSTLVEFGVFVIVYDRRTYWSLHAGDRQNCKR